MIKTKIEEITYFERVNSKIAEYEENGWKFIDIKHNYIPSPGKNVTSTLDKYLVVFQKEINHKQKTCLDPKNHGCGLPLTIKKLKS